MFSLVLLEKE